MTLELWEKRPPEEANSFNPAFIGSLMFEFAKEFQKSNKEGVPLTYFPLALAIVLQRRSRQRLPLSTVTSMYEWVQNNEDILIGLSERIGGLMPYSKEAFGFLLKQQAVEFGEDHFVVTSKNKAHFTASYLRETTSEITDIINKTKFLARWFLKSGSESTILAFWGLKP